MKTGICGATCTFLVCVVFPYLNSLPSTFCFFSPSSPLPSFLLPFFHFPFLPRAVPSFLCPSVLPSLLLYTSFVFHPPSLISFLSSSIPFLSLFSSFLTFCPPILPCPLPFFLLSFLIISFLPPSPPPCYFTFFIPSSFLPSSFIYVLFLTVIGQQKVNNQANETVTYRALKGELAQIVPVAVLVNYCIIL